MANDIAEKLRFEMRRGGLVLAVLAQLRNEYYGYALRKALGARGVHIEESTLYPLVRRLEQQGLLTSEWRHEDKRKKRFYTLSIEGAAVLKQLQVDWAQLNDGIQNILDGES